MLAAVENDNAIAAVRNLDRADRPAFDGFAERNDPDGVGIERRERVDVRVHFAEVAVVGEPIGGWRGPPRRDGYHRNHRRSDDRQTPERCDVHDSSVRHNARARSDR